MAEVSSIVFSPACITFSSYQFCHPVGATILADPSEVTFGEIFALKLTSLALPWRDRNTTGAVLAVLQVPSNPVSKRSHLAWTEPLVIIPIRINQTLLSRPSRRKGPWLVNPLILGPYEEVHRGSSCQVEYEI